jgi:acyl transferase domain-containing protein
LANLLGIGELEKDAGQTRISEAEFSQPLCTTLQVALVDLLTFWGVTPRAVAGHSSGEIAAAYAVGAISKESAWKIAYWRGK